MLSAGRGEWESVQVVVNAIMPLKGVRVSVSDLRSSSGVITAAANVALYRETYLQVKSSPDLGGPNRPQGVGWYADGLIPFVNHGKAVRAAVPFNVPAGENQPVWVDFYVPADAVPGTYSGCVSVTSNHGESQVSVKLNVWRFRLPVQPSLHSSIGLHHDRTFDPQIQRLLVEHRLNPTLIRPQDASKLAAKGLNMAGMSFSGNDDAKACKLDQPPPVDVLQASADRYHAPVRTYVYVADEIGRCGNLVSRIRSWGYNLHRAGSSALTTIMPSPELYDDGSHTGRSAVDIWVILGWQHEKWPWAVAKAQQKGDEVWSYTALEEDNYTPKWLVDFNLINFRIQPGFINQSLGLKGVLYWAADHWGADPWHNQNYQTDGLTYAGEGVLIYPGKPVGVDGAVPSIRLKQLRDGVEDYEYVELLKKRNAGAWALEQVRTIAAGWKDWTKDPDALSRTREQLGRKLDELSIE
jgi:hypothetical protein